MKKHRKVTASQAALDRKLAGRRPTFAEGTILSRSEYARALAWFAMYGDPADARTYLSDWLRSKNLKRDLASLRRVPNSYLPLTAAWICFLDLQNVVFPPGEDPHQFVRRQLLWSFRHKEDEPKAAAVRSTIQQNVSEKLSRFLGEVEGMLDDEVDIDMTLLLRQNNISPAASREIAERFRPRLLEITEALGSKPDPQVREAYRRWDKKDLKKRLDVLSAIIVAAEEHAHNAKVHRKVRAKKTMSSEKKVRGFKHKLHDSSLNLSGLPATELIGKSEAWFYNARTRVLTVLRTSNNDLLDVKGNGVIHHDPKISVSKKIRENKVQSSLTTVRDGGKKDRASLMDALTTKPCGLQARGNAEQLIVRAA